MITKFPLRFDGHGINDASGRRICKLDSGEIKQYTDEGKVNPEFEWLSILFSSAPDLLEALKSLTMAVESITAHPPGSTRDELIERLHLGHDKGLREARAAIDKATRA